MLIHPETIDVTWSLCGAAMCRVVRVDAKLVHLVTWQKGGSRPTFRVDHAIVDRGHWNRVAGGLWPVLSLPMIVTDPETVRRMTELRERERSP